MWILEALRKRLLFRQMELGSRSRATRGRSTWIVMHVCRHKMVLTNLWLASRSSCSTSMVRAKFPPFTTPLRTPKVSLSSTCLKRQRMAWVGRLNSRWLEIRSSRSAHGRRTRTQISTPWQPAATCTTVASIPAWLVSGRAGILQLAFTVLWVRKLYSRSVQMWMAGLPSLKLIGPRRRLQIKSGLRAL